MKKRLFAILLVLVSLVALVGCGSDPVVDYWNKFVSAVNAKDMTYISNQFNLNDSDKAKFVTENEEYYRSIPEIKCNSVTKVADCQFSSALYINNYFQLSVDATVGGVPEKFMVYIREDNKGLFFCSNFNFTNDEEDYGNKPDQLFAKSVYYQNDKYVYSFNEDHTEAYYVKSLTNERNIVIPDEIDGVPVTKVCSYAFYRVTKILSFSIPKSKLQTIVIPETCKVIEDYAFSQCTKLKEVHIPAAVETIKTRAFTGCKRVTKIYFDVETDEVDSSRGAVSQTESSAFAIEGGYNMIVGDIINLTCPDRASVTWSAPTNASTLITIDPDTGTARALGAGKVTLTAMDTQTKEKATIDIEIVDLGAKLQVNYDAFDRLNKLQAVYINASSPITIKIINGAKFNLNKTCKIYVPVDSVAMYQASSFWSDYANQIIGA